MSVREVVESFDYVARTKPRWLGRMRLGLIRAVAARHDVCESLLFTWRRQVREGVLTAASEMTMFVPVQMTEAAHAASTPSNPAPHSAPPVRSTPTSGLIEIELGDGRHVRVGSDVNLGALRRVLAALRE